MSTREMKLRKLQPQALAFAMPPMVRARRAIRVTSRVRLSRNERPEKPKTTKIRLRNETSTNADAANRPQRISISSGKMFLLYKGFHFSHWRVVIEKEDVKKMPFMLLPWSSRKTRSPTHISGCILTSTPCGPVLIIYIYTPPPLPKLKELLNVEERKFRGGFPRPFPIPWFVSARCLVYAWTARHLWPGSFQSVQGQRDIFLKARTAQDCHYSLPPGSTEQAPRCLATAPLGRATLRYFMNSRSCARRLS